MKFAVHIEGTKRTVEIEPLGAREFRARLDDQTMSADAVEIGAGTFSILLAGHAFEARVSRDGHGESDLLVRCAGRDFRVQVRDPRSWRAGRRAAIEAAGPQQVVAPMPGKVVRLLVSVGETVEAGRGLVVVEAMKMQNEIRAPKSGRVERVLVAEGQAVRTQETLLVIT
jgi:acetyl/propionyl-CoA carboxylase alpha subunit